MALSGKRGNIPCKVGLHLRKGLWERIRPCCMKNSARFVPSKEYDERLGMKAGIYVKFGDSPPTEPGACGPVVKHKMGGTCPSGSWGRMSQVRIPLVLRILSLT